MNSLSELAPWLTVMVVLIGCSGFFSASEAALFYLRPAQRRRLRTGTASERMASRLLDDPDRLLSAVLFWNLVVNIAYFAVSSVCALKIENELDLGEGVVIGFALVSLLAIIFFSEMLPKSFAVSVPAFVTRLIAFPLSLMVRLADPIMPTLRGTMLVSKRLLCPRFAVEPYMEVADLERAIQISGQDPSLIKEEQTVLQNIVQLSDIRIDEWMRPRSQFRLFHPPVQLTDLRGSVPPSGYVLVTEPGSDEIEKALRLDSLYAGPPDSIDSLAVPVVYLPWRATVADALEQMRQLGREVTAVVNEYGETIGILSIEDVLETVFTIDPSRSKRLLDLNPIHKIDAGRWAVAGMMSLKRLSRYFHVEIPPSRSVTIAGVLQEVTQKLAEPGDTCRWGPFQFKVIEVRQPEMVLVELRYLNDAEEASG